MATVGRKEELVRFLGCLKNQTYRELELIVVDQNTDDRVTTVLREHGAGFEIHHLRCERGRSKALNIGLKHVTGDVVVFPDDDCWYTPELLERVAQFFRDYPKWGGFGGRSVMETGEPSGGRWSRRAGPVTRNNVWRRAVSFTIFLRSSYLKNHKFDETLGVGAGTPWGAGEETDFVLQMLESGCCIYYDPTVLVYHPNMIGPLTSARYRKAESYGKGMGRVLRKNGYPFHTAIYYMLRPFGGTVLAILRGRLAQAKLHWLTFAGRFGGWFGIASSLSGPGPGQ